MIIRNTNYTSQKMLNDVLAQQQKLFDTYNKTTSGEKFSNISEDPVASSSVIGINQQMEKIASFKKNIENANTAINAQDEIFSTIITKLDRINELTIQAANAPSGTSGIDAAKTEILELKETIIGLANTEFNDMYIFSGANVRTPAYDYDKDTGKITYAGTPADDESFERNLEISNGVYVGINAAGDSIFGEYDPDNPDDATKSYGLFKVLGDLTAALDSYDTDEIRAQIDEIQNSLKNVSEIQSTFSAKVAKLTMTESNHESTELLLKSKKQNLQEINTAEAISEFVKQNYAYQASMQIYMQMQNQSLLNYL